MTFLGAFKSFWKNYFNVKGRTGRREFWYVVAWNLIIGAVLGLGLGLSWVGMATAALTLSSGLTASTVFTTFFSVLLGVYSLLAFIPCITISVRRFHDVGLSGWWYIGLYVLYLIIGWTTTGWFWGFISWLIVIANLVVVLLPADYFVTQTDEPQTKGEDSEE